MNFGTGSVECEKRRGSPAERIEAWRTTLYRFVKAIYEER